MQLSSSDGRGHRRPGSAVGEVASDRGEDTSDFPLSPPPPPPSSPNKGMCQLQRQLDAVRMDVRRQRRRRGRTDGWIDGKIEEVETGGIGPAAFVH